MQTAHYENQTVRQVVENIPEAGHVLHDHHIEIATGYKLPLYQAAQNVSASTDELLAVMEHRIRRAARSRK